MRGLLAGLGVAFVLSLAALPVFAVEEAEEPLERDWPHIGLFGTYDRAALQRGYRVYKDVCSACHSLKYISFRNLVEIGFTEAEAKAVAPVTWMTKFRFKSFLITKIVWNPRHHGQPRVHFFSGSLIHHAEHLV